MEEGERTKGVCVLLFRIKQEGGSMYEGGNGVFPPMLKTQSFLHDTLNHGLSYCTGSGVWLLLIKDGLTLTSQRRFS